MLARIIDLMEMEMATTMAITMYDRRKRYMHHTYSSIRTSDECACAYIYILAQHPNGHFHSRRILRNDKPSHYQSQFIPQNRRSSHQGRDATYKYISFPLRKTAEYRMQSAMQISRSNYILFKQIM